MYVRGLFLFLPLVLLIGGCGLYKAQPLPPPDNPLLSPFPTGVATELFGIDTESPIQIIKPILLMPFDGEKLSLNRKNEQTGVLLGVPFKTREVLDKLEKIKLHIGMNLSGQKVPFTWYDKNKVALDQSVSTDEPNEVLRKGQLPGTGYHPTYTKLQDLVYAFGISKLSKGEVSSNSLIDKPTDWSLGPEMKVLGENFEADYALFIFQGDRCCFDLLNPYKIKRFKSIETYQGAIPYGTETFNYRTYRIHYGFLTLIELKTGNVVWFKSYSENLKEPLVSKEWKYKYEYGMYYDAHLEWLLEDFPLG